MTGSYRSSHEPRAHMSPHRHSDAYLALVLDGGYFETSIDGRFWCRAGVLVVHPPWHAHADEFGDDGAVVLNLPAPTIDRFATVTVRNPQAIEKLANRCPEKAALAALEDATDCEAIAPATWLVSLVALIARHPETDIAELARRCGVSPEYASRACKRWFGVGPAALRREGRLRRAIDLLSQGETPADVAATAGFCDQPHLTRLLKRATGLTPARLAAR